MSLPEQIFFAWTYRIGNREFVIEIFPDRNCLLYDETIRRQLCHTGRSADSVLLEEIESDAPSAARARKTEFAIRFLIDSEHLELIRLAREEFDRLGDVSSVLATRINLRFKPVFSREVEPFLSVPLGADPE